MYSTGRLWDAFAYGVFNTVPTKPPMEPEMKLFIRFPWGVYTVIHS
jgi:hypothetical protein